jgi:EAL domain-containing protein (putative c-di-GMP-specific phosphodiesterase class I)
VGENGWATLSLVEEYSFGKIKIDAQHFIGNDGGKSAEGAIRAASSFAHAMSRRVVAERIESAQQMDFMRMCGCDAAQGQFIGVPLAGKADGLNASMSSAQMTI